MLFRSLSTSPTLTGTITAAAAHFSGNVGIGTTNPSQTLDLGGGNIAMGYQIVTTSASGSSATASCPAGKQVLGGACELLSGNANLQNTTVSSTSYTCLYNGSPGSVQAQAVCANIR